MQPDPLGIEAGSQRRSSAEVDDDLDEAFYGAATYCGYLRVSWRAGTAERTGLFCNRTYLEMAGAGKEEMVER